MFAPTQVLLLWWRRRQCRPPRSRRPRRPRSAPAASRCVRRDARSRCSTRTCPTLSAWAAAVSAPPSPSTPCPKVSFHKSHFSYPFGAKWCVFLIYFAHWGVNCALAPYFTCSLDRPGWLAGHCADAKLFSLNFTWWQLLQIYRSRVVWNVANKCANRVLALLWKFALLAGVETKMVDDNWRYFGSKIFIINVFDRQIFFYKVCSLIANCHV